MLANLLQCDVMLLIMQTVLNRAHDLKSKSFSDSHLQKVNIHFVVVEKLFPRDLLKVF